MIAPCLLREFLVAKWGAMAKFFALRRALHLRFFFGHEDDTDELAQGTVINFHAS